MEHPEPIPYEAPMILDSFDASDVMGVAYGCGSQVSTTL